jgi:hypothetical protein
MSGKLMPRVIAGGALSLLYALFMASTYAGYVRMGREDYLAYESGRWASYASRSPAVGFLFTLVFFAAFFALYELIAVGADRLLYRSAAPAREAQQPEDRW